MSKFDRINRKRQDERDGRSFMAKSHGLLNGRHHPLMIIDEWSGATVFERQSARAERRKGNHEARREERRIEAQRRRDYREEVKALSGHENFGMF